MSRVVLVVEDSPQCAENLEIALQAMGGVEVALARTGGEALAILASRAVAAILTDLDMPGMHGLELIERVRSDPGSRRIPILVLSGSTRTGIRERVLLSGADGYFCKPYSPAEVRQRLEQLLHANEK